MWNANSGQRAHTHTYTVRECIAFVHQQLANLWHCRWYVFTATANGVARRPKSCVRSAKFSVFIRFCNYARTHRATTQKKSRENCESRKKRLAERVEVDLRPTAYRPLCRNNKLLFLLFLPTISFAIDCNRNKVYRYCEKNTANIAETRREAYGLCVLCHNHCEPQQCERSCDGTDRLPLYCFSAFAFNSKNDDDQLNVSQHFIQYSIEMDFQRSFAAAA